VIELAIQMRKKYLLGGRGINEIGSSFQKRQKEIISGKGNRVTVTAEVTALQKDDREGKPPVQKS